MRILVVGPSWVGDMMMSQSLYRTLKARYPQAIIDVMAPALSPGDNRRDGTCMVPSAVIADAGSQ